LTEWSASFQVVEMLLFQRGVSLPVDSAQS
jgi:hypothetical protein